MIFLSEVLTAMFYNIDMKIGFLTTAIVMFSLLGNQPSNAQTSGPIFIEPTQQAQPSVSARLPLVVTPSPRQAGNQRSQNSAMALATMRPKSNPGYQMRELRNPYAGTPFGRIRSEKEYYDTVTKRSVNQYDYMKLLSDRGETAKLAQVRTYLQQYGVFNPDKYRQAMKGGGTGGSANQSGQGQQASNDSQRPQTFVRQQQPANPQIPQRIHQGYDDQPDPAETMQNRPIFLQ